VVLNDVLGKDLKYQKIGSGYNSAAHSRCYILPVLSAMTAGAQRDQIIGFIRPQLAAMYEMMDVQIF
jgi:hypothetical protein